VTPLFTYTGLADAVYSVSWSFFFSSRRPHTIFDCDWSSDVCSSDRSPLFTYRGHTSDVLSVAWSPDGKHLASASSDKTVQVWNEIGRASCRERGENTDVVVSVDWSTDGKRLDSASHDKTVQVWDAIV